MLVKIVFYGLLEQTLLFFQVEAMTYLHKIIGGEVPQAFPQANRFQLDLQLMQVTLWLLILINFKPTRFDFF